MLAFNFVLIVLVCILMIPVVILLMQVLAATLLVKSAPIEVYSKQRPSVAILMPAHNESLMITQTIQSILPQLTSQDRLLVVADNCSDDTAAISRALGATVIERSNQQQRGKGFALDFGLQYLKDNPPQVVLIIDADCIVSNNAIAQLMTTCLDQQRPVQALYIMQAQSNPSLKERIAEFAWLVKNKVRPLGFKALGLPCQLMGTGMAFLWEDITKISLSSGHIVEDMKLGIDLARLNKAPFFSPEALVTSFFPLTREGASTQRARWEHGHLSVIINEVPGLFFEAFKNKNMQMLGLACDLFIPPLAVLTLLCVIVFTTSLLFASKLALLLSTYLIAGLLVSVLLAWASFGRDVISFKQLCYAPIYALVKIPLYIKFFLNRQVEWVRSKRD